MHIGALSPLPGLVVTIGKPQTAVVLKGFWTRYNFTGLFRSKNKPINPKLLCSIQSGKSILWQPPYEKYPNLRDLLLYLQTTPAEASRVLNKALEVEYCQALLPHQRAKLGYLNEYHDHPVW
jgi:hypothetical protein